MISRGTADKVVTSTFNGPSLLAVEGDLVFVAGTRAIDPDVTTVPAQSCLAGGFDIQRGVGSEIRYAVARFEFYDLAVDAFGADDGATAHDRFNYGPFR